eukprot:jgi/Psemu1/305539/fgenesh1_kg.203_\
MMEQAFDRQTPRSRKMNNEKLRAERKSNTDSALQDSEQQESSISTDGTASTEQGLTEQESKTSTTSQASNQEKSIGMKAIGPPSILHTISKEAPMVSGIYAFPQQNSMASSSVAYPNMGWNNFINHPHCVVSPNPSLYDVQSGQSTRTGDGENQNVVWQPGENLRSPGGLTPNPFGYWHTVPPHVQHYPPQPAYSTVVHPQIMHMQQQGIGMNMQQYNMENMPQPPQYPHNPPVYLPTEFRSEIGIPSTNGYNYGYGDQYTGPYYVEGIETRTDVSNKIPTESLSEAASRDTAGFPPLSVPPVSESSPPAVSTSSQTPEPARVTSVAATAIAVEQPDVGEEDSVEPHSSPSLSTSLSTSSVGKTATAAPVVGESDTASVPGTNDKFDGSST